MEPGSPKTPKRTEEPCPGPPLEPGSLLVARLAEANRELESLSYSISHDLRSPLRAIDGFTQAIEEDVGAQLPEESRRHLAIVREEACRMGRLIDDLLAYSRLLRSPYQPTTVDMAEVAGRVLTELSSTHPVQGVRIGSLPPAQADPALVHQLWRHLLSNALKFSSRQDAPVVKVDAEGTGTGTVYRVRDNGVGFDMQYAHKLFGLFQRLHKAGDFPGNGVGLALARRIVDRHGGRIWAESTASGGAAFFFTLGGGA
jgi:light-regulated signal transduction histidine kinase (bacteriophytochrome)